MALTSIKEFLLNLFFPPFCVNCRKEGSYLCQDCFSLIDLSTNLYCPFCDFPKIVLDGKTCLTCRKKGKKLTGLFFATSYENYIIKKIISQFKYPPYLKELAKTLALLIIAHFQILEKNLDFSNFLLVPIPLDRKKIKERGFNQAEEIAKELSNFLPASLTKLNQTDRKVPLVSDVLVKRKVTLPQVELSGKQREENVKGAFSCQNIEKIKNKKILLIDDVFTTGSTLEEAAKVLKKAGAKEVWGVVVARGGKVFS